MKVLLDAATTAAAIRGRLPVVLKLSELRPPNVAISIVAQVQLEAGLRRQMRAQAQYGRLLKEFLETVRVIDFGPREAQQASQLASYLVQTGEPLGGFELIQAATALAHGLTLVAADTRPYLTIPGLEAESWLRGR